MIARILFRLSPPHVSRIGARLDIYVISQLEEKK